jgi:DNA-binding LytR/AlgR family response regulator|tara:strand:+ start:3453 stop:4103 length:651 start_codon:yes stop_codon:yes gene_type:complete
MSIVKLVKQHPALTLIAEYSSAIDTKKGLNNIEVDLIFLDIEMPIVNGFELLDVLKNKPQIIFVTGKTEYAFKAFDYDATDYLHKPITHDRFNLGVEKALEYHRLKFENNAKNEEYIFIKSNLKKRKVLVSSILWIEALGDYIKLITNDENYVILSTMKAFEKEVEQYSFLRIHKSYIVNLNKIKRFNSKFVEINSENIPLSRNKKKILTEALDNL